MNTPTLFRKFAARGIVGLAVVAGVAALEKGGSAFSKRNETSLLAEPKPLATAVGKVGFAEELKIDDVRGSWLHVKGAKIAGWVYVGNVADEKPATPPSTGLTAALTASDTDTAAAARPLAPVAAEFATRHNATDAQADVEWLDQEAAKLPPALIESYLRDNKKGEYQP
jgi:hypothetical protein